MAIDSAAKRASVAGLIIPDGTLDQGDRQTIARMYSGILATASAVVSGLLNVAITATYPGVAVTATYPGVAITATYPGVAITGDA